MFVPAGFKQHDLYDLADEAIQDALFLNNPCKKSSVRLICAEAFTPCTYVGNYSTLPSYCVTVFESVFLRREWGETKARKQD